MLKSLKSVLLAFSFLLMVTTAGCDQGEPEPKTAVPDAVQSRGTNPPAEPAGKTLGEDVKKAPENSSASKLTGTSTPQLNKDLTDWEVIKFGGEGDIAIKDGVLSLDYGSPLTGVRYTGDLDELFGQGRNHYAITLEAQRYEGSDMFLGLTFPVGTVGHVSLVLGGWGGATTGISSLDGLNASENDTGDIIGFTDQQWYKVKVLVTPEKIECYLDGKQIVDVKRADYKEYTTHGAVIDTVPFGIFTYDTWAKYKDVKVWTLD